MGAQRLPCDALSPRGPSGALACVGCGGGTVAERLSDAAHATKRWPSQQGPTGNCSTLATSLLARGCAPKVPISSCFLPRPPPPTPTPPFGSRLELTSACGSLRWLCARGQVAVVPSRLPFGSWGGGESPFPSRTAPQWGGPRGDTPAQLPEERLGRPCGAVGGSRSARPGAFARADP